MEKERKVKKLALVAVIVAVLGMTIAFAALSQTLTINGTANMEESWWGITFSSLGAPKLIGTASIDTVPTISNESTEITNIGVTLKKPGDEVRYTATIYNEGNINAEVASIEMPTLTDAQKEIFDFSVIYENDGKEVSVGDVFPGYSSLDDQTCESCEQNVIIKIRFKDITDASLLPEEAQSITLSYKLNFIQSDSSALHHVGDTLFGIELSNGQTPVVTGNATATNPTLVGNMITGYKVMFSSDNDTAKYTFDITNTGIQTVTINSQIIGYASGFNDCNNKSITSYPDCSIFDFNNSSDVTNIDLSELRNYQLKSKLVGSDGSNKIPANTTKTFTLTTVHDESGLSIDRTLPAVIGDISIVPE